MKKAERDEALEKRMHIFDGWVKEGKIPCSSKVIPVQQSLELLQWVLPTQQVLEILRNSRSFALANCDCRTKHKRCDNPLETCFYTNDVADKKVEQGEARRVSLQEAAEALLRDVMSEAIVCSDADAVASRTVAKNVLVGRGGRGKGLHGNAYGVPVGDTSNRGTLQVVRRPVEVQRMPNRRVPRGLVLRRVLRHVGQTRRLVEPPGDGDGGPDYRVAGTPGLRGTYPQEGRPPAQVTPRSRR